MIQMLSAHAEVDVIDDRQLWLQQQSGNELDIDNFHDPIVTFAGHRIPLNKHRAALQQGLIGSEKQ